MYSCCWAGTWHYVDIIKTKRAEKMKVFVYRYDLIATEQNPLAIRMIQTGRILKNVNVWNALKELKGFRDLGLEVTVTGR